MAPRRKKARTTPAEADGESKTENETKEEEEEEDETELGSKVLRLRLTREGAHSCSALQASLIWNDVADLDLSCITPDGTTIYYNNKEAECGGWLDVDMNVDKETASIEPVENIFWASAPSGKYVFRVTNFNCHTKANTVFVDSKRSVPYRLFLTRNGKKDVFDGSVKHKEVQVCFEFELEGEGALGSFVVMPPSDTKTTFKQACEANDVTYSKGNGYYALARKENISQKKVMLLQDIEKDTFIIGGEAVRKKLDWPINVKQIRKGPKDLPEGYRLFVQSTSHNRLIPPGTHTLMKVSIQEALKHRPAHTTRFTEETHTMGQQQDTDQETALPSSSNIHVEPSFMQSLPDSIQLKIYDSFLNIHEYRQQCLVQTVVEHCRENDEDFNFWHDDSGIDFKEFPNEDLPDKIRYSYELLDVLNFDLLGVVICKRKFPLKIDDIEQEVEVVALFINGNSGELNRISLYDSKTYQYLTTLPNEEFEDVDLDESDPNHLRMENVIMSCIERTYPFKDWLKEYLGEGEDEEEYDKDTAEKYYQLKKKMEEADDYTKCGDNFTSMRPIIHARALACD